jgi:hypothetical protein
MSIELQLSPAYSVMTKSWPEVAATMPQADAEDTSTPENFLEGSELDDVFALNDRNNFSQEWPHRRIFLVMGDDCVHLFDVNGVAIDEPGENVVKGVQHLQGPQPL